MNSDISGPDRTPRGNRNRRPGPRGQSANRSSPQPPSDINGGLSDVEGFADDEVVGSRGTGNRPRDPLAAAISKVVDRVGEKVAEEFENFLEKYASKLQIFTRKDLISLVSLRTLYLLALHLLAQ